MGGLLGEGGGGAKGMSPLPSQIIGPPLPTPMTSDSDYKCFKQTVV